MVNILPAQHIFVCASCGRPNCRWLSFAGDTLFTGAMSEAEKTERDPGNGDKENGESGEKSKSGNFLDPMKVFIIQ